MKRMAALATLVAGDDVLRDPATWGAGQCVAYLFLQGEQSMELADVWQEYLQSCPTGSYTVHVHLQSPAPFPVKDAQIVTSPVEGDLRYSWQMQAAMHKLFRSALNSTTGCKPVWLQLISGDTAPIQSCRTVHELLGKNSGKSLIEAVRCPEAVAGPNDWEPALVVAPLDAPLLPPPPGSPSPSPLPPPPPPPPPLGIDPAVGPAEPEAQEGKGCWEKNRPLDLPAEAPVGVCEDWCVENADIWTGAEAHDRFCKNSDCLGCKFCGGLSQAPPPWFKSSQWVTLWADHARHLLDTDASPPSWKAALPVGLGLGAPDEFFTVNVRLMRLETERDYPAPARLLPSTPPNSLRVCCVLQVLSGANFPIRKTGLVYVVGFLTTGHAIAASCDSLPINLNADPAVKASPNAWRTALECRADTTCRCKIYGRCAADMTTEPTHEYPVHDSAYYCKNYNLCTNLPVHLRPGAPAVGAPAAGAPAAGAPTAPMPQPNGDPVRPVMKCIDAAGEPVFCSAEGATPAPANGGVQPTMKCIDAAGEPAFCSAAGTRPAPGRQFRDANALASTPAGNGNEAGARQTHGGPPRSVRLSRDVGDDEEGRIAPTYDALGDLTGVTVLSRVIRGADAEGKMFVRKVDGGCSEFLLQLLKERVLGAPILMTRKPVGKLRAGVAKPAQEAALQPESTGRNSSNPLPLEPPTEAEMESLPSEYRLTRALWRHYCSINGQDC